MGVWTNLTYLKKNHYVIWQQNESLSYIKKTYKIEASSKTKEEIIYIYIYIHTCIYAKVNKS